MTQFYSRNDTAFNGDVYSIPFSYSKEEEINVFIDEELYTDWQFLNESQIQLLNVPSTATSTSIVSVRRITDISEKVVDYTNNSLLNKENLNKSQDQLLQAVQEIYDNNTQFGIDVDNILVENKAEMDAVIEQNKQEILGIQSQFEEETNATIAKNRQEILTIQSQFEKETNDALDEYKEITDAKVVEIDRLAKSVVDTANNALATSKEAEQTADSAVSKADSAVSTANSANTTANRAETIANTANETSNQAVTIANTATNTSNQALETANTALQNSASAVNTANTSSSKVDMFGESIETVLDAADKIFELDESVQTAVNAAELANQAAESATQAAENAISTLNSKADKTDIKNGKLTIQANGSTVATFTANQAGDSTANIVIPDSAQWGKITGTLSSQTDLQNALNGKLSITGTADKALKDSNGLQINTNYMRKTIGDAWIPATSTAPTALAMVGKQACGNGNIAGGNLVALHKNTLFRCYERGSTITCNYEDKVANLGKTMCDGSFSGHYTQINPSTSFTSKPFVWEVTSPTQYEVSDVCRLHIYSHRLSDSLNVTEFKIEAYIQDTLTNSKKWVTTYEYSGASKNIAQTGFGLYKTGYSSTSYYSIFGIRLTISGSPDTVFKMSQVQIVASRGTETLADSLQCVSNAGGKVWGNLEVTGQITVPTKATGTNNTTVATTAFVNNAITDKAYTKAELDAILAKRGDVHNMFDTVLKDHILTYEESKGLALQGTYVYKEAVAGSRYGYSTFYEKCVEEKANATATETTLGDNTITMYINANGHQFYDIADKEAVDSWYNVYGRAWFYGVDTENERIFLPRNSKYFKIGDETTVGTNQDAGLPNIEGSAVAILRQATQGGNPATLGAFSWADKYEKQATTDSGAGKGYWSESRLLLDASRSNPIYGNSDTVELDSVNMLLYICVGNTESEEALTNVTEITTSENDTLPWGYHFYSGELLEAPIGYIESLGQWNDGTGLYEQFYSKAVNKLGEAFAGGYIKEVTEEYDDYDLVINQTDMTFRLPLLDGSEDLPSEKYIDLTVNADNSTYTALANGYIVGNPKFNAIDGYFSLINDETGFGHTQQANTSADETRVFLPVHKGDVIRYEYGNVSHFAYFRFIYAQGNGSLYFKVANAVQNLELLDVGKVMEEAVLKSTMVEISETSWAFPSDRYIDLTLGASGTTYTAPANGWYYLSGKATANNGWIDWVVSNEMYGGNPNNTNTGNVKALIPITKGYTAQIFYGNFNKLQFRFIYAEGDQ